GPKNNPDVVAKNDTKKPGKADDPAKASDPVADPGAKPSPPLKKEDSPQPPLKKDDPAPQPPAVVRPYQSEHATLTALRNHLRQTPKEERRFQRYFTLDHLFNNPRVTEGDLRIYRTALTNYFAVLTRGQPGVSLRPLNAELTLYQIDLRQLGWDRTDA